MLPTGVSACESFDATQATCYGEDDVLESPSMRVIHRRLAAMRLAIVRRYLPEGTIFEVGPGSGEFLRLARSWGYEVSGIELGPVLAERLRETLGIAIESGAFETMDLSGRAYRGVISSHVIEHVPDPLRHMNAARRALVPGGFFFLSTPNLDSWNRRLAGNRWPLYSAGHLHLFGTTSLVRLLERTNWQVIGVHTIEHALDWPWTLMYMRRAPREREARPLEQAGVLTRKIPHLMTATAASVAAVFSWPLRRLQNALGRGNELFIVARSPG